MAVVKEWACLEHGPFESSHPICPNFGCDSKNVVREIRTAPAMRSDGMKKFDAGIRRSSDLMGGANFRTAREGEASFGGQAARDAGTEVLWGNESKAKLGKSFAELTNLAAKPLEVKKRDGSGTLRLDRNNAMREAAMEAGITRRRLPRAAELTREPGTKPDVVKAIIE